jgi:phage gpG-like protein
MISIKIDDSAMRRLAEAGGSIAAAASVAALKGAQHATSVMRREVRETFPRGRTGQLARSWRERFVGLESGAITAVVESSLVYAKIHDIGGTIEPITVKKLAIPINAPLGKWPRHFGEDQLRLIPRPGRNSLLVQPIGKKGKFRVMFVLVPEVSIAGRNYTTRAASKAEPDVLRIVEREITSATGGLG